MSVPTRRRLAFFSLLGLWGLGIWVARDQVKTRHYSSLRGLAHEEFSEVNPRVRELRLVHDLWEYFKGVRSYQRPL